MADLPTLTPQQARLLQLGAQGLLAGPPKRATRAALLATIERMGLLQIDTIHVVSRSPYLVLYSRLGSYPREWLEDALAAGQVFETWAHEACFAPRADLPLHRAFNRDARRHWGLRHAQAAHTKERRHMDALLAHIETVGPVKSSDFERTGDRSSPWWGWKDEKRWLEALFALGELMVARRDNFHRVYDLTERVAPEVAAASDYSGNQAREAFIEKSLHALGIAQAGWIHDYFRMQPRLRDAQMQALVDAGVAHRIAVDGWDAPAYVHRDHTKLLRAVVRGKAGANHTTLLSPFDPLVWDRDRASVMWNFDYRLECYTPEPKRTYGYFVLPILCGDAIIGRLDAKAHRQDGVLEIRALYSEERVRWSDTQVAAVARAVQDFAVWHATPNVVLRRSSPSNLTAKMRKALREITSSR